NYAKTLAHGPARAVSLIKRAVLEGVEMPLAGGLAWERELQNRLFVTDDAKEGLAAFTEKRKPSFKGR
ncbi:MAG TPA: enoyl-CoA hydratase-related protein, partial [Thermoplasmata archaeon]|nr:enoyl-CoA hydratase-related protein [Thermoplasmata archaeon]